MGLHQIRSFAHQKKQLPESRDNQPNGRKILPAIKQTMD
jgi:hypothetical protein